MIDVVVNVTAGVINFAINVSPSPGSKLLVVIVVCAPVLGKSIRSSVIGDPIGTVCAAVGPS